MEKSTEEKKKMEGGKNALLNLELFKEATITLHFTLVDDIPSSLETCPTSPGLSAWDAEADGLGAQESRAVCLDLGLENPHPCPVWGLFKSGFA